MKDLIEKISDYFFRRKWRRIKEGIENTRPEEGLDGLTAEAFYDLACRNADYGLVKKGTRL